METELFIDTQRLRLHAEDVKRSRRKAQLLCDMLRMARDFGETVDPARFQSMISDSSSLLNYYSGLERVLDDICDETGAVSRHIDERLEDSIITMHAVMRRALPTE